LIFKKLIFSIIKKTKKPIKNIFKFQFSLKKYFIEDTSDLLFGKLTVLENVEVLILEEGPMYLVLTLK